MYRPTIEDFPPHKQHVSYFALLMAWDKSTMMHHN
jgi:hypothetical protein